MTLLRVLLSLSAVLALANGVCFDNGDKEIGGKCFKFVAKQLSFEDARNYCHYTSSNPAYLAYVPDQFTANFLASYARSLFNTNDGFFWIGLSRTKSYNPWTWDTGFQLAWSNFNGNQLSDNFVAESIVNGKWNTFGDDTKLYFVCSYDPTAPPTFAPPASTTPGTTTSTTTTTSVPTTTASYFTCDPDTSIFFLAYSSRLLVDNFKLVKSTIIDNLLKNPLQYTQFANLRLDNDQYNEAIYYHTTIGNFSDSIDAHLPDSSLATAHYTDAYDFLMEFSNNAALCGSRIFLLMDVLPDYNEEWPFLSEKLMNNRVEVFFIVITYNGGSPFPLMDLAYATNGIISWVHEDAINEVAGYFFKAPYTDQLLFSYSFTTGDGNVTSYQAGEFATPTSGQSVLDLTLVLTTGSYYFDHFISSTVYFINQETNERVAFSYVPSDRVPNSDLIYKKIQLESGVYYAVAYDYESESFGAIEIRIYY